MILLPLMMWQPYLRFQGAFLLVLGQVFPAACCFWLAALGAGAFPSDARCQCVLILGPSSTAQQASSFASGFASGVSLRGGLLGKQGWARGGCGAVVSVVRCLEARHTKLTLTGPRRQGSGAQGEGLQPLSSSQCQAEGPRARVACGGGGVGEGPQGESEESILAPTQGLHQDHQDHQARVRRKERKAARKRLGEATACGVVGASLLSPSSGVKPGPQDAHAHLLERLLPPHQDNRTQQRAWQKELISDAGAGPLRVLCWEEGQEGEGRCKPRRLRGVQETQAQGTRGGCGDFYYEWDPRGGFWLSREGQVPLHSQVWQVEEPEAEEVQAEAAEAAELELLLGLAPGFEGGESEAIDHIDAGGGEDLFFF